MAALPTFCRLCGVVLTQSAAVGESADKPRDYSALIVWGFGALALILAAAPIFNWLGIGTKISKLRIGDILSASGLILAVFGFGITFSQLLRTKRSSEAASNAVKKPVISLAGF